MSAILPPFTIVIYVTITVRLSYAKYMICKAETQAQGIILSQSPTTDADKISKKIMENFFPYASKYARSVMDLVTLYVRFFRLKLTFLLKSTFELFTVQRGTDCCRFITLE